MKVIFFGTPNFIEPILNELKKSYELIEVIRKPEVFDEKKINEIKDLSPDLFIVAAYGIILPDKLLKIPKLGAINIHPSLLPKYRGASPIQNAILNDDKTTGVTFIKMDEKMDHGPILFQKEVDILPNDTFQSLAEKLFQISASDLKKVIIDYKQTQSGKTQNDSEATFTKLINKDDGFIDVSTPPKKEKLEHMIRAYFPWPSVWTKFSLSDKEVIIKLLPNQGIQVEGKKPMSFKDFKNGYEKADEFLEKLNLN